MPAAEGLVRKRTGYRAHASNDFRFEPKTWPHAGGPNSVDHRSKPAVGNLFEEGSHSPTESHQPPFPPSWHPASIQKNFGPQGGCSINQGDLPFGGGIRHEAVNDVVVDNREGSAVGVRPANEAPIGGQFSSSRINPSTGTNGGGGWNGRKEAPGFPMHIPLVLFKSRSRKNQ